MKFKRIEVPIYGVTLYLFVGKDVEKIRKKIRALGLRMRDKDNRDLDPIHTGGMVCPLFDKDERREYFFWMPSFSSSVVDHDTLAHEIIHVKNYILQHIGLKDGLPSKLDEIEAYLVGYLTQEILTFLRRK